MHFRINGEEIKTPSSQSWRAVFRAVEECEGFRLSWRHNKTRQAKFSLIKHTTPFPVEVVIFEDPVSHIRELIDVAHHWPFEIMDWGPAWNSWLDEDNQEGVYESYRKFKASFGRGFGVHGVMCAFRGRGHRELVSRRWLDYGPWRTIRDETTDTTYVQFHDYQADSQTALDQAGPGWQHMGISNNGGFLQSNYPFRYEWKGNYVPDQKLFRVIVAFDGEVNEDRLTEACALRRDQMLGPDKPIDNVAFVFLDPTVAHRHLHNLWLRDLQCRTFDRSTPDAPEIRLDNTYEPPPPVKPQWVIDLEAREAEQGITWFRDPT